MSRRRFSNRPAIIDCGPAIAAIVRHQPGIQAEELMEKFDLDRQAAEECIELYAPDLEVRPAS